MQYLKELLISSGGIFALLASLVMIGGSFFIWHYRQLLKERIEENKTQKKLLEDIYTQSRKNLNPQNSYSRHIAKNELTQLAKLRKRELPKQIVISISNLDADDLKSWQDLERKVLQAKRRHGWKSLIPFF